MRENCRLSSACGNEGGLPEPPPSSCARLPWAVAHIPLPVLVEVNTYKSCFCQQQTKKEAMPIPQGRIRLRNCLTDPPARQKQFQKHEKITTTK
jgi:hypothetical protein